MAARYSQARNQAVSGRRYYVDGSAARQEYYYDREDYREERQVRRAPRPGKAARKKVMRTTMPLTMFLAASCILTLAIVFQYIQMNASIREREAHLEVLTAEVNAARKANDVQEANLASGIRLDQIQDIAINQLGMVYPSSEQMIEYEQSESEYVRQYDRIPTETGD